MPDDLSPWIELSEEGKALLHSDQTWKSEEVNSKVLRELALHCKANHDVHSKTAASATLATNQSLGFYQLAFFNLWNFVQENHGSVSTG